MDEHWFVVTDEIWASLEPNLPDKKSASGATAKNKRLFLEAVLWRGRTGLSWRDLPLEFGTRTAYCAGFAEGPSAEFSSASLKRSALSS